MRKQDIIFAILKSHALKGEDIHGDGVLEDNRGFVSANDGDESESDDPPGLIHLDESDNEFVAQ